MTDHGEGVASGDSESLTVLSRRWRAGSSDRLPDSFLHVIDRDTSPGIHPDVRRASCRPCDIRTLHESAGTTGTDPGDGEVAGDHTPRGVVIGVVNSGSRRVYRRYDIRLDPIVYKMFGAVEGTSGPAPVLKALVTDLGKVPGMGTSADQHVIARIDLDVTLHPEKSGAISAVPDMGIGPLRPVPSPRGVGHCSAAEHIDIPDGSQLDVSEDKGGRFVISNRHPSVTDAHKVTVIIAACQGDIPTRPDIDVAGDGRENGKTVDR